MEGTGSELAISQAIRGRILLNSPIANIAWDGYGAAAFEPPTGLDPENPLPSMWVRPSHVYKSEPTAWGGGAHWSLGRGIISVQVFSPYGLSSTADELLEQMAGQVAAIYRYERFNGIECSEVDGTLLIDAESGWNQVTVNAPFLCQLRTEGLPMSEINGRMNFAQEGHDFTPGTAVTIVSGAFERADAPSLKAADAIVVGVQGDSFQIATHGMQGFTHGLGSSGKIYLSASGALTTTAPTSGPIQAMGTIKNANLLLVSREPLQVI